MEVRIKRAEIEDIKELNIISMASKMHWNYPQEWMGKWVDELMLKESDFSDQSIYKLEEMSGYIVGFCSIVEHEEEYEILHLWLRPAYIGKGYGKYLLNESLKCVANKAKPVIVEADPNAELFYSSQGFITFDRRQSYPKGRFLPLMKKVIPNNLIS